MYHNKCLETFSKLSIDKTCSMVYNSVVMRTLADAIRERMVERGWSPAHVTTALLDRGVSIHPVTVENWLSGKSAPRLGTARVLADVFGITLDSLVPASMSTE